MLLGTLKCSIQQIVSDGLIHPFIWQRWCVRAEWFICPEPVFGAPRVFKEFVVEAFFKPMCDLRSAVLAS